MFEVILKSGKYPKVNLVPEGKPTRLGMINDPIHKYDAANKNYADQILKGRNGVSVVGGVIELGGTLLQDTSIDANGYSFAISSQGANPNETISFNFLPSGNTAFASVLTDNGGVVSGPLFVINENQAAIAYSPDTSGNTENSLTSDSSGNASTGSDDLSTSSNFRAKNNSGVLLFQIMNNGDVLFHKVVNFNFADDAAAAAGGIPIAGAYHNAGQLRIRLV